MKRGKIDINDSSDLNDILSDMLSDFLENITDYDIYTYPATGESPLVEYEEGIKWYYTEKGMALIERWKTRMEKIFKTYFPDDEFNPVSTYYKEF